MCLRFCDNVVALSYATNSKLHGWTKHIDICYNVVKDIDEKGSSLRVHSYESLGSRLVDETY